MYDLKSITLQELSAKLLMEDLVLRLAESYVLLKSFSCHLLRQLGSLSYETLNQKRTFPVSCSAQCIVMLWTALQFIALQFNRNPIKRHDAQALCLRRRGDKIVVKRQ